jgi:cation diffusion facilitator CzcD-associated flavoprotein CzcO
VATALDHKVIIIGAGSSGLCMAIKLKEQGIDDLVLLDKASGLGGTWYHNTYPGAGCDVQSHLYSFSFEPKLDWSQPFAGQKEVLQYLNHCADKYDVRRHIKFNNGVTKAVWNDEASYWTVTTEDGKKLTAKVVISALGMFNNVVWPKIKGMPNFKGEAFHSARWNHDIDLTDKKVAVIGIAASAIQFVPEIAKKVGQLNLFQRTANWVVPKKNTPYLPEELESFRSNPELVSTSRKETYRLWNTLATFNDEKILKNIELSGLDRITQVNDPETRAKLTPKHPFGCKRPLFSDVYYPVFNMPHVSLITDDIAEITETGVVTANGQVTEIDVIIYSTGFETTTYLNAIEVMGRGGERLKDAWADGAQAYLGVTTNGFPNLFMLYGPNTNQGCILVMIEQQVKYILRLLDRLESEKIDWLNVKKDVMDSFNEQLQVDIKNVDVWQHSCGNDFYYRAGPSGRFVTQWPKSMDDFSAATGKVDEGSYEVG